MKNILVLGAGTMGAGIAQAVAEAGCNVMLRDIDPKFVENGLTAIAQNLERAVKKGKMDQNEQEKILKRVKGIVDLKDALDVDLVIEAIVEKLEIKNTVYRELDQICKPETIFASNTSSLSITAMGAATKRADKVIGMHFFNPVQIMELVEVIKGSDTSEETFQRVYDFVKFIGKTPVVVNEAPGFVVNRMLVPMINEAVYLLMEGIASKEDIDTSMKLGASHPIGPLALADLIGLDICLDVMEVLHNEFGEDKYRPCPLLRKMVRSGKLGRKTKKGFYQY
jgi:3-hydroxybutyryl-CoA dehydrogenase